MANFNKAARAVIKVGLGRGFVVQSGRRRLIITAAHCLPSFPPCHGASFTEERTYAQLLGPLGNEPSVWAECLFADPIGDIAVLGEPDGQELSDECEAYDELVKACEPIPVTDAKESGRARLLSLDGEWIECDVKHSGGPLWISGAAKGINGGMSGSPIIADDGSAIGIVCLSGGPPEKLHTDGGPNPRLLGNLPGWLLKSLNRS